VSPSKKTQPPTPTRRRAGAVLKQRERPQGSLTRIAPEDPHTAGRKRAGVKGGPPDARSSYRAPHLPRCPACKLRSTAVIGFRPRASTNIFSCSTRRRLPSAPRANRGGPVRATGGLGVGPLLRADGPRSHAQNRMPVGRCVAHEGCTAAPNRAKNRCSQWVGYAGGARALYACQ
jgi:hypothetical protein